MRTLYLVLFLSSFIDSAHAHVPTPTVYAGVGGKLRQLREQEARERAARERQLAPRQHAADVAEQLPLEERVAALEKLLEASRGRQLSPDGEFWKPKTPGESVQYIADTVWVVTAALFCFFLQAGFGLLEAGALRAKNAKNIMLKNLMDACIGGLVYYCFGYALSYGGPGDGTGNPFSGGAITNYFMLVDVPYSEYYIFLFQYVFAATIATIVSGAVAERIQFKAYMIYSFVLTGFIYPWAAHWTWSGDGFLYQWGVTDYAGGNAVHALSGCAAFVGAKALGPRIGRFVDGKPVELAQHNVPMMTLGLFILWLGFIPFIAGSACAVNFQMGRLAVMTTLCGCSGGCFSVLYAFFVKKHASLEAGIVGVLAGMVGICTSCGVTTVWAAFWIIAPLSVLAYYFGMWVNLKLKVDDPLGASALHYYPGAVSMIMTGFFAEPTLWEATYGFGVSIGQSRGCTTKECYAGVFYGGNGEQLAYQFAGLLIMTVYGLGTCALLFYGMKLAGVLRVSVEDELEGLDKTHHGGPAYEDNDYAVAIEVLNTGRPGFFKRKKKDAETEKTTDTVDSGETLAAA